jgi:hypothetical protein
MSDHETRRRFLQGTSTIAVLGIAGCLGNDQGDDGMDDGSDDTNEDGMDDGDDVTGDGMEEEGDGMEDGEADSTMDPISFTVRIENVAPTDFYSADASTGGAVWITPGAYGVHTGETPIYATGEAASVGLTAQAEGGQPSGFEGEHGLVDELEESMEVAHAGAFTPEDTVADPNDPMDEVPGAPPIAPEGAFEFETEAEEGQHLSLASMFVPSNDVFFSTSEEGIPLWPEDGEPVDGEVTDCVRLFDAGTEPNAEPPGFGPDQAPTQDTFDQGADEGGVVRHLSDVDDGHDYPDAADAIRVTVTPQ